MLFGVSRKVLFVTRLEAEAAKELATQNESVVVALSELLAQPRRT